MSTIPSNLDAAIHSFTIIKGDKKELVYTFPYAISDLTFEIVLFSNKDNSIEIPTQHNVDGTYDLYVMLDATGENLIEDGYSYGVRHTGDGIPVTCIIGDVSLVKKGKS